MSGDEDELAIDGTTSGNEELLPFQNVMLEIDVVTAIELDADPVIVMVETTEVSLVELAKLPNEELYDEALNKYLLVVLLEEDNKRDNDEMDMGWDAEVIDDRFDTGGTSVTIFDECLRVEVLTENLTIELLGDDDTSELDDNFRLPVKDVREEEAEYV